MEPELRRLDELGDDSSAEEAWEAVQAAMDVESAAGNFAPELDVAALPKLPRRPTAKQLRGLQRLRDLYVCVRSEAARYGPLRCGFWARIRLSG